MTDNKIIESNNNKKGQDVKLPKEDIKNKKHQENLNELKKEKEKTRNDSISKVKKDKKNVFYTYNAKISLIATCIIILIIILIKIYGYRETNNIIKNKDQDILLKTQTTNKIQNNNVKNNINHQDDDKITEINNLKNEIDDLEKKLSYNNEYIKSLEDKIAELEDTVEIQKNQLNAKNIDKIRILVNIQKNIQRGKNYSNLLNQLEKISYNNNILVNQENIEILKKYQNNYPSKMKIDRDFEKEKKIFLDKNNILKNSQDNFAKFLSNFVIVRKIDNADVESSDNFLLELENNIKNNNYLEVFNLLNTNTEYSKYFIKTLQNVKEYILLNNIIDDMINNNTIEND